MTQNMNNNTENKQIRTLYFVRRNKSGSYDITDREGKFVTVCDNKGIALSTARFFTAIDRGATQ